MTIPREFHSIEQALREVIKNLKDSIETIGGKTESHFRKCSDENDKDHQILHRESIWLDIECMRRGLGSPMLSAHQYQIDKASYEAEQTVAETKATTRASALAKLAALGLSPEEIAAL